jgi:hypothetical protein
MLFSCWDGGGGGGMLRAWRAEGCKSFTAKRAPNGGGTSLNHLARKTSNDARAEFRRRRIRPAARAIYLYK